MKKKERKKEHRERKKENEGQNLTERKNAWIHQGKIIERIKEARKADGKIYWLNERKRKGNMASKQENREENKSRREK